MQVSVEAPSKLERRITVVVPVELLPITTRLDQLMDRLEKSFVRERNFSSDLSHEIRTPIAELRVIAESAIKWPDEGGPEAWNKCGGNSQSCRLKRNRSDHLHY